MQHFNRNSGFLFAQSPTGPVNRVERAVAKTQLTDEGRCFGCARFLYSAQAIELVESICGETLLKQRRLIPVAESADHETVCQACHETGKALITNAVWPWREMVTRILCGGTLGQFSELVFGDDRLEVEDTLAPFLETALQYASKPPRFSGDAKIKHTMCQAFWLNDREGKAYDAAQLLVWQTQMAHILWTQFYEPNPVDKTACRANEAFVESCNKITAGERPPAASFAVANTPFHLHLEPLISAGEGLRTVLQINGKRRYPLMVTEVKP